MDLQTTHGLLLAVVDDDDVYREFITKLLTAQPNVRVKQAADRSALEKILDSHSIDCIVLDYNLGHESGLAIGDFVHKRYADPPPIVMLTGEGGERTVVKAFRSGFSDYVSKRDMHAQEL